MPNKPCCPRYFSKDNTIHWFQPHKSSLRPITATKILFIALICKWTLNARGKNASDILFSDCFTTNYWVIYSIKILTKVNCKQCIVHNGTLFVFVSINAYSHAEKKSLFNMAKYQHWTISAGMFRRLLWYPSLAVLFEKTSKNDCYFH